MDSADDSSSAHDRAGGAVAHPNVAAIAYRAASDGEWPAVGMLTTEGDGGKVVQICSGALIQTTKYRSLNVVLSAKHCGEQMKQFYLGNGKAAAKATQDTLLFDAEMRLFTSAANVGIGRGTWLTRAADGSLKIPPDFDDIQLIRLNYAPEGVEPLLLNEPISVTLNMNAFDRAGTVIGFGLDQLSTEPEQTLSKSKHILPVLLRKTFGISNYYRQTALPTATAEASDCPIASGDSGGPLVANRNGVSGPVLGVASSTLPCKGDQFIAAYARVDAPSVYRAIEELLAEWQKTPAPPSKGRGYVAFPFGPAPTPSSSSGPPSPSDPTRLGIR